MSRAYTSIVVVCLQGQFYFNLRSTVTKTRVPFSLQPRIRNVSDHDDTGRSRGLLQATIAGESADRPHGHVRSKYFGATRAVMT
jgi:hypothetical protein